MTTHEALKQLRQGIEAKLPYVATLVSEGEIKRDDALAALRKCLKARVSDYAAMANEGSREKWEKRIEDAVTAMRDIDEGKNSITYKGTTI